MTPPSNCSNAFVADVLYYIEKINRFSTKELNNILRNQGLPLSSNGDNSIWRKRLILLQDFIIEHKTNGSVGNPMLWANFHSCVSYYPSNCKDSYFDDRIGNMIELYIQ